MSGKSFSMKVVLPPKTPDEWVNAGSEPGKAAPPAEREFTVLQSEIVPVASPARPVAVKPAPVKMKRFTFDVPADVHRRMKRACFDEETDMADVIRAWMAKKYPPEKT
jgi:hypothetical protein